MISWAGSPPACSAQTASARVSAASPGALTPSSLVPRILPVRSPYRRHRDRSGPVHPPFGPFSPGRHIGPASPSCTPHPRRGPGLLQFTGHARPDAQDLRRLTDRAAVADRPRAPGGRRLRGGCDPAGLLRRPDHGAGRLRGRRVVPFGPGSGARPVAQPPGRRPLRVQRRAGPGGPGRARAPQRHPRAGPLDALDPPDPAPEPALPALAAPPLARLPLLPVVGDRVARRTGGTDRD